MDGEVKSSPQAGTDGGGTPAAQSHPGLETALCNNTDTNRLPGEAQLSHAKGTLPTGSWNHGIVWDSTIHKTNIKCCHLSLAEGSQCTTRACTGMDVKEELPSVPQTEQSRTRLSPHLHCSQRRAATEGLCQQTQRNGRYKSRQQHRSSLRGACQWPSKAEKHCSTCEETTSQPQSWP